MATEEEKQAVWEKGKIVPSYDPNVWRKDICNAWINRLEHGNRDSDYGWEIDHIDPDGPDELRNKRPLQWKNNVAKLDNLHWSCVVTSFENKNIHTS